MESRQESRHESRRRHGSRRHSHIQEQGEQSIQRRTSKKSSSHDRRGQVYPDDFRERTIRPVTPEVPVKTTNLRSDSESDPASPTSPPYSSPRPAAPRRILTPSVDHSSAPSNRREWQGLPNGSASASHPRPGTRTLEEGMREQSPPQLGSKTRQRIGSLQRGPNRGDENHASSIGYPTIIPSPPSDPERREPRRRLIPSPPLDTEPRRRLVKLKSRPLSPISGSHSIRNTTSNSSSATDVSKVLQLMKTTCGRMHGILSFRTSGSGSWSSGYCAINVATGSLIYQTKGDVAHARTLIPDLRGCQVRTLYDVESRSTFLDVSNHTTMIGIHLRPHVAETFDSWLAALLCWQPIRPKGVYNKLTKPRASPPPEWRSDGSRRTSEHGDRRRNSEIFFHKDAAIIKVGKMLIWDKDFRNALPLTTSSRRVSTYRQQRSLSASWRKVSCTLQENGHFRLYTDTDVALVSMVPLCQLQRCSVQRLHPSVLDDEFCLAIYPQYTSSLDQSAHIFPVYLSLESRVLFEVWFVLLRAFTIPELYGPEQVFINPQLVPADVARNVSRPPSISADMFRVEKLLSLRIIEAKMFSARRRHSRRASSRPQHQEQSRKALLPGSYLAEVRLDGMVRGKTSVKHETGNPFWREDFEFHDLPPVLSTACIEIKTRNPGQKDWTLVSDGPLDLERAQLDPLAIVGDIEISPLETTYGVVELQFDENDHVVKTEKWWPILNDADEVVGEVLMGLHIEEFVVLMGRDYQRLSELLHNFSNSLTVQIAAAYPPDLVRKLAEILLNIFQVSAQASEWLLSLVEEEIDNVHKETHHSKYRYGRRIASNDSFESGMEREVILRDLGKTAVVEANQLFRGNTLLTKALDCHMKRLGHDYLEETLGEKIRQIDETNPECEIDPNRVQDPEDLERNWRTLSALIESVWTSISESALRCPPELRLIFRHISACAEDRYGDFLRTVTYSSVSGFLFLRFFCPALLNPHLFGLLKDHPRPQAQRTLTLVSKTLNTLANLGTFGSKEPWMEPMNGFLNTHRQGFKTFVDTICSISPDNANSAIPPSYATPITILGRLPGTSREGFPSLPYLIDQAKECAALVDLWLDRPHHGDGPLLMTEELQTFNDTCESSREKTQHCLSRAEQAERPSGVLERKWEELVEQMGRKARIRIANGQKSAEPTARASAEEARRKAQVGIESENVSIAEANRNPEFYTSTQNSTATSLASSYMHRNNEDSQDTSKHGTLLVNASESFREGDSFPPMANRMQESRCGTRDDYDIDTMEAEVGTPPGSSSAVWDPGVFRGLGPYTPVTASSGEDMGFGNEEIEAGYREGGSSIYRIGTPSSSSRIRRHHRPPRSVPEQKSSGQAHRGGNRSAFGVDASSELSNTPKRSPLSSRDGPPDPPPNGKSIYRLKNPTNVTTPDRQMEHIPRCGTPRSPGSRDGGRNLFGDFGSVFRRRGKEQERDEKGTR
ncbi:MAG: hypothetical protein LQ341_001153 [Variospora aurantia]|nr:MAG: hypothetical protein LQ341_001153 [Variospora aurantia]